jgi:hypothetical protein
MMLRSVIFLAMAVPLVGNAPGDRVMAPAEAVSLIDSSSRPVKGMFEMTVAAVGHERSVTFVNSAADYRSRDCLTFRLSPNVVRSLEKRYGQPVDRYLLGKHVTVKGTLRRELIVNKQGGVVIDANRWQHVVRVLLADQLSVG